MSWFRKKLTEEEKTEEDFLAEEVMELLKNPKDWRLLSRTHGGSYIEIEHIATGMKMQGGRGYYVKMSFPEEYTFRKRYRWSINTLLKQHSSHFYSIKIGFLLGFVRQEYLISIDVGEDKKLAEVKAWLLKEVRTGFYLIGRTIWFKDKDMAMKFKLTWK